MVVLEWRVELAQIVCDRCGGIPFRRRVEPACTDPDGHYWVRPRKARIDMVVSHTVSLIRPGD